MFEKTSAKHLTRSLSLTSTKLCNNEDQNSGAVVNTTVHFEIILVLQKDLSFSFYLAF